MADAHQRDAAEAERLSPVAISPAARRKAAAKKTDDGLPAHSFRADLATLTRSLLMTGKAYGKGLSNCST